MVDVADLQQTPQLASWLPVNVVVSMPNPVEVHLHTEGSWWSALLSRVVLSGLGRPEPQVFIHWQANDPKTAAPVLPVRLHQQDGHINVRQGAVPLAHIFTVLRKNKLLQVGDGALKWLPSVVEVAGTRLTIAERTLQLLLYFSLLESEKLQSEATPEEHLAMQQLPAADIVAVIHHDKLKPSLIDLRQLHIRQGRWRRHTSYRGGKYIRRLLQATEQH